MAREGQGDSLRKVVTHFRLNDELAGLAVDRPELSDVRLDRRVLGIEFEEIEGGVVVNESRR